MVPSQMCVWVMRVQQVRFIPVGYILNKNYLMSEFGQVGKAESQTCSVLTLKNAI